MKSKLTQEILLKYPVEQIRELLLDDGSLIYHRLEGGETPLHLAVLKGRLTLAEMLVYTSPDMLGFADRGGETPVHVLGETFWLNGGKEGDIALEFGKLFIANGACLSHGADPNAQDQSGNTYLHRLADEAGQQPRLAIARLLVRSGASLKITNSNGETPIQMARAPKPDCQNRQLLQSFIEFFDQAE